MLNRKTESDIYVNMSFVQKFNRTHKNYDVFRDNQYQSVPNEDKSWKVQQSKDVWNIEICAYFG